MTFNDTCGGKERALVSGVTESGRWHRRDAAAIGSPPLEHFSGPDQQPAQRVTKTAMIGMSFPPNGQLIFLAESPLILLKLSFQFIQFKQHVMLLFARQNHLVNTFRIGSIPDIRSPNWQSI
jgi:hypothetical protein